MTTPAKFLAAVACSLAGWLLPAARAAEAPAPAVPRFAGATPLEWSRRLADSEMKRIGTGYEAGGVNPRARWDYSPGVMALAMVRLGETTGQAAYTEWGTRAVASHVTADGTIRGYKEDDYNIDNIPPGKVLMGGFDIVSEVLQQMEAGYIQVQVDQQPYMQGFMPVMEAYLAKNVGLLPADIDTGKGIIVKEDVPKLKELAAKGMR